MMRKSTCLIFIISFVFGPLLSADRITLKNGDRLTGTIFAMDDTELSMESELAGTIKVKLSAVESVTSAQPLYVTLKDQRIMAGLVTSRDGQVDLQTEQGGKVTLARSDIQAIRSKPEQEAYESERDRQRHPGLLDFWGGALDIGVAMTRGNAVTTETDVAMSAARTTLRDKISLYYTSLFAEDGTARDRTVTTAKSFRGGGRYDHNLKDPFFAFGVSDFESDKFQELNLRSVLGAGLGWHVVRGEATLLDLFTGAGYDQEFFATRGQRRLQDPRPRLGHFRSQSDSLTRKSWEMIIGDDFKRQLSSMVTLTQRMTYYPNLSESGEYRLAFDAAIATKISKWLEWQVSFSNRYLSNPLPGIKKNDILLTTGIRFTFGDSDQATYQGMDTSDGSTDSAQGNANQKRSPQTAARKPAKQVISPKKGAKR